MMPRKDGTPTAAERKDAERIEANRRHIAGMTDDDLATLRDNDLIQLNPEIVALIEDEMSERYRDVI
jgi:hypothetical protein